MLYTELPVPPAEVHRTLMAGRLPRLWIPSVRDFIRVEQIPITATGKIDLKALRELASARPAVGESSPSE